MRILHLSHHLGCLRDQQYVLEALGHEVTSMRFPHARHEVTRWDAWRLWRKHGDFFNGFDCVLLSDTSPMSRVFLQNRRRFRAKLVIWICNRFDYNMRGDRAYRDLFAAARDDPGVRIVPYTAFEKVWCARQGIELGAREVIRPLGKWPADGDARLPGELRLASDLAAGPADLFVSRYSNDHHFTDLAARCRSMGLRVKQGAYAHIDELRGCAAYLTLPEQFSKFVAFELLHAGIPALLPSKTLLLRLAREPRYYFNVWGSGGTEQLDAGLLDLCEWYDPAFAACRAYFDDFGEIPALLADARSIAADAFRECARAHEAQVLAQWRRLYASF